jgi:argininosuccinate lyase
MDQLPVEVFTAAHPLCGEDAREALGAEASLAFREIPGGTGPQAVQAQLAQAREAVARDLLPALR